MVKRKVIKSFENLSEEVKTALFEAYPHGFDDKIKKMEDVIKGGYFQGMLFDYDEVTYLIKFTVEDQAAIMDDLFDEEDDADFDADSDSDEIDIPEDFDD